MTVCYKTQSLGEITKGQNPLGIFLHNAKQKIKPMVYFISYILHAQSAPGIILHLEFNGVHQVSLIGIDVR